MNSLMEEITGERQSVTIPRWFDRHLHIRDGDMMKSVLPSTLAQHATGAIIMPNLMPQPVTTAARAIAYRNRILECLPPDSDFNPCMTCYLTDHTTPQEVVLGFKAGAWQAVKMYMANQEGKGGTTGSTHGVRDLEGRYPVFEAMQQNNIPLLGHFEAVEDGVDEFDREIVSVERDLQPLLQSFPRLPVVFEHLTDFRAADFVAEVNHEIYATITAHHLMVNRNELFKGGLNPGYWCKPVLKGEPHRLKLREYATSGSPSFGAGTDSAPHDESKKSLCYGCAAGIFTAPTAVEMYTTVFDEEEKLHNLGSFLSKNLLHLYGVSVSSEIMTLERRPLEVPRKIGGVQVFRGGSQLPWTLV